jgi:hypothetical protein
MPPFPSILRRRRRRRRRHTFCEEHELKSSWRLVFFLNYEKQKQKQKQNNKHTYMT